MKGLERAWCGGERPGFGAGPSLAPGAAGERHKSKWLTFLQTLSCN